MSVSSDLMLFLISATGWSTCWCLARLVRILDTAAALIRL